MDFAKKGVESEERIVSSKVSDDSVTNGKQQTNSQPPVTSASGISENQQSNICIPCDKPHNTTLRNKNSAPINFGLRKRLLTSTNFITYPKLIAHLKANIHVFCKELSLRRLHVFAIHGILAGNMSSERRERKVLSMFETWR